MQGGNTASEAPSISDDGDHQANRSNRGSRLRKQTNILHSATASPPIARHVAPPRPSHALCPRPDRRGRAKRLPPAGKSLRPLGSLPTTLTYNPPADRLPLRPRRPRHPPHHPPSPLTPLRPQDRHPRLPPPDPHLLRRLAPTATQHSVRLHHRHQPPRRPHPHLHHAALARALRRWHPRRGSCRWPIRI